MKRKRQFVKSLAFIIVLFGIFSFVTAKQLTPEQRARQILETTGIKGGVEGLGEDI